MIAEHRTIEFQTRGNDHIVDLTGYEDREYGLVMLKTGPWYDALRTHPRFQALLEKMNFPEG